jgi:transcriptional antiterminator RfaH
VTSLQQQGFNTYLPKFMRETPRKRSNVEAVLFPGYLFVEFCERWQAIFNQQHVIGMLMAGEKPAPVRDFEIDHLRAKERNGYVELPEKIVQRTRFRKGQPVRVISGPLIGHDGIVKNMSGGERVKVLFQMLGRETPVMLRSDVLSVI